MSFAWELQYIWMRTYCMYDSYHWSIFLAWGCLVIVIFCGHALTNHVWSTPCSSLRSRMWWYDLDWTIWFGSMYKSYCFLLPFQFFSFQFNLFSLLDEETVLFQKVNKSVCQNNQVSLWFCLHRHWRWMKTCLTACKKLVCVHLLHCKICLIVVSV